ncbi:MAG: Kelch repeat-containing protein [Thermoplasmatota archaeon]
MRGAFLLFLFALLLFSAAYVQGSHEEFGSVELVRELTGPRFNHTATLLKDGCVLIAGGTEDGQASLSSAEIYCPDDRIWLPSGEMLEKRQRHTADLLPDGRVLAAGGFNGEGHPSLMKDLSPTGSFSLSSTEIYNSYREAWETGPPLSTGRFWHRAVVLGDGNIVVIGGINITEGALASCELFDVRAFTWKAFPSLNVGRARFTAVLLRDGRILVAGGHDGAAKKPYSSCEVYDPALGRWEFTAPMNRARGYHAGVLLPDGRYLVSGGFSAPDRPDWSDSEVFDPYDGTWTMSGEMSFPRHNHELVSTGGAYVVVIGGSNCLTGGCHSTMEVFESESMEFRESYLSLLGRKWSTATMLTDGSVLIAGGRSCGEPTSITELYVPPAEAEENYEFWGSDASIMLVVGAVLLAAVSLLCRAHGGSG